MKKYPPPISPRCYLSITACVFLRCAWLRAREWHQSERGMWWLALDACQLHCTCPTQYESCFCVNFNRPLSPPWLASTLYCILHSQRAINQSTLSMPHQPAKWTLRLLRINNRLKYSIDDKMRYRRYLTSSFTITMYKFIFLSDAAA